MIIGFWNDRRGRSSCKCVQSPDFRFGAGLLVSRSQPVRLPWGLIMRTNRSINGTIRFAAVTSMTSGAIMNCLISSRICRSSLSRISSSMTIDFNVLRTLLWHNNQATVTLPDKTKTDLARITCCFFVFQSFISSSVNLFGAGIQYRSTSISNNSLTVMKDLKVIRKSLKNTGSTSRLVSTQLRGRQISEAVQYLHGRAQLDVPLGRYVFQQ